MTFKSAITVLAVGLLCANIKAYSQKDTLKLMTYNVLYYGETPPCQGPHKASHGYLKTIIEYTRPDVLGLVKTAAAPLSGDEKFATAPVGFPDSILRFALNAAWPDLYAYCPYTNVAMSNNAGLLFYNKHKLGFVSIVSSYANITDFNTYKLYYKDPNLERTHDTTFLYVTLNHDKSGDENVVVRGKQINGEMEQIRKHFTHLPNMVNMGDFNVRSSDEPCYQALVFPEDTTFRFYDPPFYPDAQLKYPANWDKNRTDFAPYLTTSTRKDENVPNDCGTGGGAKNWYDHIFLSEWIVNNTDYIRYIPNSYRTIGNDGHRYKISINDNNSINTSAPPEVIEALFQMSNKYPVMAELEVAQNVDGKSAGNMEKAASDIAARVNVTIDNPVKDEFHIHFDEAQIGQEIMMECHDSDGKEVLQKTLKVKNTTMNVAAPLPAGKYHVSFHTTHNTISECDIVKE